MEKFISIGKAAKILGVTPLTQWSCITQLLHKDESFKDVAVA